MTKVLVAAACLGLSLSAASACEFMRSAKTHVDQTVVASIVTEDQASMSTPADAILLPEPAVPAAAAEEITQ